MHPVAEIIRKNLLGNRAIEIPSFGTITVRRYGAAPVDSGQRLRSPWRSVAVTDDDAPSVIEYIVSELNVDETEAVLQYNDWLDGAVEEGFFIVEGVGSFDIESAEVRLQPDFDALLNPAPQEKVILYGRKEIQAPRIRPRKKNTFMVTIAIIATLAALAYLAYYFADDLAQLIK